MKEKIFYHLPIISLIVTGVLALIAGAFVGYANAYSSEENIPTWASALAITFVILMLIALTITTIIKNKSNTKTIELAIELPIALAGYIILMIFINKDESSTRILWLTIATSIFMGGLMPGICSIIGKIRKAPF